MNGDPEFAEVRRLFRNRWPGREPTHLVRAPGRINLIGEHTDYNGFPVMPIAIDRAIYLACGPSDGPVVELANTEGDTYGPRRFELDTDIPPDAPGDWANYVKAAVQSLTRRMAQAGTPLRRLRGMRCAVGGDIPSGAGLSSSSALVVGAALAFCAANGLEVDRMELAALMAQAEHYVGTQGGGMDQAVCLLAREGHALKIDFFPLRITAVPFPEGYCVLAAHSTVPSEKTRARRLAYNRRVLECRIGTALLARELGAEQAERLADVAAACGVPLSEMPRVLYHIVGGAESVSARRAAALLDMGFGAFVERYLTMNDGTVLREPPDGLKVLPRCRHVFSEAARVEEAASCLGSGELRALGRLMDESHRSCACDYEISRPELDELAGIMREAGALGARLTGAGFGGFAIGLVEESQAAEVARCLSERFYSPRGLSAPGNIFTFRPAPAARQQGQRRAPRPST